MLLYLDRGVAPSWPCAGKILVSSAEPWLRCPPPSLSLSLRLLTPARHYSFMWKNSFSLNLKGKGLSISSKFFCFFFNGQAECLLIGKDVDLCLRFVLYEGFPCPLRLCEEASSTLHEKPNFKQNSTLFQPDAWTKVIRNDGRLIGYL